MSGGFNPINLVSQAALGIATGGMSLWAQLGTQLLSSIGQQVIGEMGKELGLPSSVTDMAKGAFAAEMGDVSGMTSNYQSALQDIQDAAPNATPTELGQLQSGADQAHSALSDIARGIIQNGQALDGGSSADDETTGSSKGSGGGAPSWLMAIAKSLANMLTDQANKLTDKMNSTDWQDPGQSAEFQAQSQEFSLAMSSATNAIKTIGDALSQMARKN